MEQKNQCLASSSSSSSLSSLFLLVFSFFLVTCLSASASTSISGDVFGDRSSLGGRNLLQAKKPCPVNFEFLDYKNLTSQCKGPQYLPKLCCPAFTQFACPYAAQINDLTNDCATTMFSYINLYGKYPPGLFASECREGPQGLACTATAPAESANVSGSQIISIPSPLVVLTAGLLVVVFHFF